MIKQSYPNDDKKLMINFIIPFIAILEKHGVSLHDFVKIWKKYKINRDELSNILKMEEVNINTQEIITSNRQLSHSNSEEKNVFFTYHAAIDPDGTIQFLQKYICNYLPITCNKMNLFYELKREVEEVKKEKERFQSCFRQSSSPGTSASPGSPYPPNSLNSPHSPCPPVSLHFHDSQSSYESEEPKSQPPPDSQSLSQTSSPEVKSEQITNNQWFSSFHSSSVTPAEVNTVFCSSSDYDSEDPGEYFNLLN